MMRFVVSDLDGTLLDAKTRIAPATQAVLRELLAKGVPVAIATGRHASQVHRLWPDDLPPVPVISANGARIHAAEGTLLRAANLLPALVNKLLQPEIVRELEVAVYRDALIQAYHSSNELTHYTGVAQALPDPANFQASDVGKVIYCGTPEKLAETEAVIRERFDGQISMTYSQAHYLEVMAPGVNKGSALSYLLAPLGVAAADCVAFGDNLNDVEMLQLVGHPHAMANAHPALFTLVPAARKIGHHDEAGVAEALKAYLAEGRFKV